ncbi:Geranylgeranyl transferase type-1 subunit beta [Penicillium rolfsii]|nr:Geranylgeranyl transferase type-1 subunit beta [Penicillium rolfsii]
MAGPIFNTERHVKYYLRCLKTFLPSAYTSNDSNRMLLAYLTLGGLDVLGVLQSKTTPEERQGYIDWLYHCQVPSGGFRGFSGTNFGDEKRTSDNESWDPANVPATFFALVNLLILGDDLARVKRRECLKWLPKMQREDGSFGEVLGPNGTVEGDSDLRYCCCASGIRYILRGQSGVGVEDAPDIDVSKLISFIEACQSYDGGMGESPFRESHSGHTYCAVGSLHFLRQETDRTPYAQLLSPGSRKFETLVGWLASRQTDKLLGEEEEEEEEEEEKEEAADNDNEEESPSAEAEVETGTESVEDLIRGLPNMTPLSGDTISCAGFNGRCNKLADTCYSFWNGAALMMLDRYGVIDGARNRQYLLEKTQHLVGGFGKGVGDLPDLLHSYFGLVSLAFQGEAGLARVDPALVATERTVEHLKSLPWWT